MRDYAEALSWYRQYLDKQPNGPKAAMAKINIRDLEPKTPPTTEVREVPPAPPPPPPAPSGSAPDEPRRATPPDPQKQNEEAPRPLPRLPANEESPPP